MNHTIELTGKISYRPRRPLTVAALVGLWRYWLTGDYHCLTRAGWVMVIDVECE